MIAAQKFSGIIFSPFACPNYIANKILRAENLITKLFKVRLLIIIYADKYYPVIAQQIAGQLQARVNKAQPVGMKAAIACGISDKIITVFINLFTIF